MANVEVGKLSDHLTDDEVDDILAAMQKADVPPPPEGDESGARTVASGIEEDAMNEFMDRLEAHDLAADLFVPMEFEGLVEAGDLRIGSLGTLMEVLEALAEDLDIEDPDEPGGLDDDDDELAFASELDMLEGRLRHIWQALFEGTHLALDHDLCLIITK